MTDKTPNLRIRDDGSIVIKNVTLSYPHLFEKWDKDGDAKKEKYGATFILDKKIHANEIEKINQLLTQRQKDKFKKRLPKDKLCLRDGDDTGKPEYEGKMILVASDKKVEPTLLDRDGKRRVKESDDKLYAGALVNGMVAFWDQDNQHGQRINANLLGVQWMDHGERFSTVSRPKADEMFEDEGEGEGSDADGFDD